MILFVNFQTRQLETKQEPCQKENLQKSKYTYKCIWCDGKFFTNDHAQNFCSEECYDQHFDYYTPDKMLCLNLDCKVAFYEEESVYANYCSEECYIADNYSHCVYCSNEGFKGEMIVEHYCSKACYIEDTGDTDCIGDY